MSLVDHYIRQGFPLLNKTYGMTVGGTAVVWTPKSGHRVVVTNIVISSNLTSTIAFYFDNDNDLIAQFNLPASATITPVLSGWESTVSSGNIRAVLQTGTTGAPTFINLSGFEVPASGF